MKRSWLKRNRDNIIVGVITMLIGAAIGAGVTYYYGEQSQAISNSGTLALAHQNTALHNGVNSNVVILPNGLFSNSDSVNVKATISLTASIGIFIRCNDGTTFNGTGPFSCPHTSSSPVSAALQPTHLLSRFT